MTLDTRLTFFIALRYLFSKKSQNAINIISLISVLGVVVSTAALVCVMSVFNGFVAVIEDSFAAFDAELEITAAEGKVFDYEDVQKILDDNKNVEAYSYVLEDNALISYGENQTPFTIKGVDNNYHRVFQLDSLMIEGQFRLYDFDFDVSVVGIGLATKLNLGVDYINGLTIYVPQRQGKINIARPDAAFKKGELFVSGIFSSYQPEIDDNTLITPLEFTQKMYDYDSLTVSAIDIKLKNPKRLAKTQKELRQQIGNRFLVKNRTEQQEDYFKIIKVERMLIIIILSFMIFIAICNIIGSISMLLIEKQEDIAILNKLGMNIRQTSAIFVAEGWLMSLIGVVVGIALGVLLCFLQYQFGFIKMNESSYVENYPVVINALDILLIFTIVVLIGLATATATVKLYFGNNKNKLM